MYFLQHKDQAHTAFFDFLAEAERQTGYKLLCLRTDRGGEFYTHAFVAKLKELGIRHETSMPRTPEQNGRAERFQQTIVNKSVSMRTYAGLSKGFWKCAIETAVHTYNRTPLKRLKWKTPYVLWNQRHDPELPKVSYFRIFGCAAYMNIHKKHRDKLDAKAKPLIFVGYADGSKGYRLWDKAIRTFIESSDVVFDEYFFPNKPITPPSLPDVTTDEDEIVTPSSSRSSSPSRTSESSRPSSPRASESSKHHYHPAPDSDSDDDAPGHGPFERNHQSGNNSDNASEHSKHELPSNKDLSGPRAALPSRQHGHSGAPLPGRYPESSSRRDQAHQEPLNHPSNQARLPQPPNVQRNPLPPRPPRPERTTAGQNPFRTRDSAYGDRTGVQIDKDTTKSGQYKDSTDGANMITSDSIPEMLLHAFTNVPVTHRDVIKSSDRKQWEEAMNDEYKSLMEMGTWDKELVELPKGRKAVKCRWVFVRKLDGRYKARVVAKGFTQVYGIDYEETFSPVARFESIRLLLAHAALDNWEIEAMDVKTAFLNGVLNEEIYMEQPEGFVKRGQEGKVCRLRHAIYGLKQASRTWYDKFNKTLKDLGFHRIHSDGGVYVHRLQGGGTDIIIVLYVDDLLLMGPQIDDIVTLKKSLQKQYQMKDLGQANSYLGIRIARDRAKRTIKIDQESYIHDALEKFSMLDAKPARTPLPSGAVLIASDKPSSPQLRLQYQSIIGTLLYVMLGTRPDIAYAVTRLSRYNANPSEENLKSAKYILRYLKGTPDYKITYNGASNSGLIGYSDSDWGENKDDRHSTSGFVFFMADAVVSWVSRRQKTVALSTADAEYMTLSDSSRQLAWLRSFQQELGFKHNSPTPLCADNQGAIFLAVNPAHDRRTKHIDIRYHFVREYIEDGNATIYYVATDEMIADIMTKSLPFATHEKFTRAMGLARI